MSDASLPWRGPGEGRPDLPLPPEQLSVRRGGLWRKRWRYAAAFSDELLVCAARVTVGPVGQTFWAVWNRGERRLLERTRLLMPGARGEVWTEGRDAEGQLLHAPDEGSVVRVESKDPDAGDVRAFLRFEGGGRWVEAVCPTEDGQYVWTRKRVDVPVEADVRLGPSRLVSKARGVEDESEGYHPRHTVWDWSAGVGTTADGRSVGWNLVSGINDPPERSERAIWIDGEPSEPGPVEFEGLDAISFEDGARLDFSGECERRKDDRQLFVRYSYRQPMGTFSGTLPGGIALASGLGVMEHHDAHW